MQGKRFYAAILISSFPQILLHHRLHHPDLLHTSKHHLAPTFLLQPKKGGEKKRKKKTRERERMQEKETERGLTLKKKIKKIFKNEVFL